MAGSIMVRYARKTSKQLAKERSGSHAQMSKQLNYSIDIDPESISMMTFETYEEARKFANNMQEAGNHIIDIKDDYYKRQ
tara:strand:- start:365 stop:604 length:240 start_codon:yes stop_codon:yes gene_type:complete